ncbi:MAG: hypothetical protein ACP5U0_01865 [Caldisphaera sp.]
MFTDNLIENGIYFFDKSSFNWKKINCDEFRKENGINVIYFSNRYCAACKLFNLLWYPFVDKFVRTNKNIDFIYFFVVSCNWFIYDCKSECALNAFKKYSINVSPVTLLIMNCYNNKIIKVIEGNVGEKLLYNELTKLINKYNRILESIKQKNK